MKKLISLFIISALIITLCSCSQKAEKKSAVDKAAYKAYVSDCDKGVAASFCGMESSLETSEKAREYFTSNSRERDGFLITDYLDGICINRVLEPEKWDCVIPERIEGKPVIKLGCYIYNEYLVMPFIKFDNGRSGHITLPDSVKYIDEKNLCDSPYNRIYYKVSKSNPYYATDRDQRLLFIKNNGYYEPAPNSVDYGEYYYLASERKVSEGSSLNNQKHDADYKKLHGYDEYISDCDKGVATSFCGMESSLETSEKAREYFASNSRERDGFLITDYLDGICINRVLKPSKWDGRIPEKIEGKPVIKLGSFIANGNCTVSFAYDKDGREIYLPKTVKYIDKNNLYSGLCYFTVDKENPYYATGSEDNEFFYAINEFFYAIEDGYVQPVYIYIDDGEM